MRALQSQPNEAQMRYLDLLVKSRVNKALLHVAKQVDLHRGFRATTPALSLAPPSREATPDMINRLDLLWTSEETHDGLRSVERMRIRSLMLGPTPVRGVECYPYENPEVVRRVQENDRILDTRIGMLRPTPVYPESNAGLGLYMARPMSTPPARTTTSRPSTGVPETPIAPLGEPIPQPELWGNSARENTAPTQPQHSRKRSGPPKPFMTPYLAAACQGAIVRDTQGRLAATATPYFPSLQPEVETGHPPRL